MNLKFFIRSLLFRLSLFACVAIAVSACIPNRNLVYFPDPNFNTRELSRLDNKPVDYHLQPRDILSVRIKTLDSETSDYFNIQPDNNFFNFNPASMYLSGYSIDNDGNIMMPEAGAVKVGGLTLQEAQQKIQECMSSYLKNATILVKLVSFKVTVLGEVQNPGYYYIYNDQATILEGLGMAGDLTDFGNRENITLIRQTENGSGAVLLNLKDPELLSSSFYYLQPNDVLYVQPLRAKTSRNNLNMVTLVSVFFGAVSSTVLLLQYFRN